MSNWIPKVGDKVKVNFDTGIVYGNIIWVEEPCKYHSGRFGVHLHEKYYEYNREFWWSDIDNSVTYCNK